MSHSKTTGQVYAGILRARLQRARKGAYPERAKAPQPAAPLPEFLTVASQFNCNRWHASCHGQRINDYQTERAAVLVVAREAWEKLIGHGVLLREVTIEPTDRAGLYLARVRVRERRAA